MTEGRQSTTKADLTQAGSQLMPRLTEQLRHFEISLLTVFHDHAQEVSIHFRKIEADVSNVDAATLARLEAVEQRMLAIEMRLPHASQ